jgi:hypothetical protein
MTASPQNQAYFCSCNVKGYNIKNKREIMCPNIQSAILPTPHRPEIPVASQPENLDLYSPVSNSEISEVKSDSDFQVETTAKKPEFFLHKMN